MEQNFPNVLNQSSFKGVSGYKLTVEYATVHIHYLGQAGQLPAAVVRYCSATLLSTRQL